VKSKPSIYILAGDISYNRGDLASLHAQVSEIRNLYPEANITCCALDPDCCAPYIDARIIRRSYGINITQWKYLRSADLVIWGGGAQLADHSCRLLVPYWTFMLLIIRYVMRRHIIGISQGAVLETRMGRFFARICVCLPEVIACRDVSSYNLLRSLGTSAKLILASDVALLLTPQPAEMPVSGGDVAISLTFWNLYNSKRDFLPYILRRKLGIFRLHHKRKMQVFKIQMAALISALLVRSEGNVRLIPRYFDPLWDDILHLEQIRDLCMEPSRVFIHRENMHPACYPAFLARHRLVLAVPFHDIILALHSGVPVVALPNEQKGLELMQELGLQGMSCKALFDEGGVGKILSAIEKATSCELAGFKLLQAKAQINIELIVQTLQKFSRT
jgi:polysaccharide pyruvyl transferase WcaK-like protein